jgi:hypothetical protein
MGLRDAIDDTGRADRASAVLAIVGVVNVPIIHYSVIWWNSLHQAPSVMKFGKPTMVPSMLVPLLLMLAGFTALFIALLLVRARGEVSAARAQCALDRRVVRRRAEGLNDASVPANGWLCALCLAVLCADSTGRRSEYLLGAPLAAQRAD